MAQGRRDRVCPGGVRIGGDVGRRSPSGGVRRPDVRADPAGVGLVTPVGGNLPRMRLAFAAAVGAATAVSLAGAPAELASARPATGQPTVTAGHVAKSVEFSSGKPRNARLTIPAVGIRSLKVVAYRGRT